MPWGWRCQSRAPASSGLRARVLWERLAPTGARLGLVRDVGGQQPRLRLRSVPAPCCSPRLMDFEPGSLLGAQCQSLCLAVLKRRLPGRRNAEGWVGARLGDPSGCGTGHRGSHPGRPKLLSALGYLQSISLATPSSEESGGFAAVVSSCGSKS